MVTVGARGDIEVIAGKVMGGKLGSADKLGGSNDGDSPTTDGTR